MDNLHVNISPNFKMMTYKQVEKFQKIVKSTPSFTNISWKHCDTEKPERFSSEDEFLQELFAVHCTEIFDMVQHCSMGTLKEHFSKVTDYNSGL